MTFLYTHRRAFSPRLGVALATALTLALLVSSPAWAETVKGTDDDDIIVGTKHADTIRAKDGDDLVVGRKGKDEIDCGKGYDVVVTDGNDDIDDNCERIYETHD